jgi:hypothetical protein
MRDLIKKLLREEVDRKELETKIRRWVGDTDDPEVGNRLKNIQAKLQLKIPIEDDEYVFFEDFLKNEIQRRKTSTNTMSGKMMRTKQNFFNPPKDQQNKITELGRKAYLDLIQTNLSVFFNQAFNPKFNMRIGKPGKGWFKQNLILLNRFEKDVEPWKNNFVKWVEGPAMTIGEKITELKNKLENENWFGLIEEDDWSILNHVDTNYTFWADEITKRQEGGDLPMGSDIKVIELYFTPRRLESALPKKWQPILDRMMKEKNVDIKLISMAHVDLLEKFHEEKEKDFQDMKRKLKFTTTLGETAEKNFVDLIQNAPTKVTEIKKYSTWGNVIDMVFGVDMTAKFIDGFRLVQVKNGEGKAKSAFVKSLKIPYLSVFPGRLPEPGVRRRKNPYEFLYFSEQNNKESKSFNQNYLRTDKEVDLPLSDEEKKAKYSEKEIRALEKVLGKTLPDDYFAMNK